MPYQSVFRRYELKYLLTRAQKARIVQAIAPYMQLDQYGHSVIRNLYFDTDSYRLIRRSMEKPAYKEKLRLRSYSRATCQSPVFVELKKKYDGVVYKRRLSLPEQEALAWLGGGELPQDTQIAREIDYFLRFYGTRHPTLFLSYEREAYYCRDGGDFRLTFDENILCRQTELSLETEAYGTPLLDEDTVLMELKCSGGIPLWLVRVLSEEKLYKTSFSKYGTAYQRLIFPQIKERKQDGTAIQGIV